MLFLLLYYLLEHFPSFFKTLVSFSFPGNLEIGKSIVLLFNLDQLHK